MTEITGYDETPWPDVSFTLSIGDTFSVSGSQVQVQSGTSLDVDQSFIDLLLGISAILATFVSPAFYFAVLGFVAEGAIIVSTEPGNFGGGAGAAAAQNIPTDILIPQGQKVVFKYSGVAIDCGRDDGVRGDADSCRERRASQWSGPGNSALTLARLR